MRYLYIYDVIKKVEDKKTSFNCFEENGQDLYLGSREEGEALSDYHRGYAFVKSPLLPCHLCIYHVDPGC